METTVVGDFSLFFVGQNKISEQLENYDCSRDKLILSRVIDKKAIVSFKRLI